MKTISHLINPFSVGEESDLHIAQPITFESMRVAKNFAKGAAKVRLLTAQYPEDKEYIPHYFEQTSNLERSILDLFAFEKQKKMPLIKDLLGRLYEASPDSEYLIYTNVDIHLMPFFYASVSDLISQGYDAIMVNRRTIPNDFTSPKELTKMYMKVGKPHNGIDCFIFKRALFPSFLFSNSFVGAGPVGLIIAANLVVACEKLIWIEKADLTFHLGNERVWANDEMKDYRMQNYEEYNCVLSNLLSSLPDSPLAEIKRSALSLMKKHCVESQSLLSSNDDPTGNLPRHLKKSKNMLRRFSSGDYQEILNMTK